MSLRSSLVGASAVAFAVVASNADAQMPDNTINHAQWVAAQRIQTLVHISKRQGRDKSFVSQGARDVEEGKFQSLFGDLNCGNTGNALLCQIEPGNRAVKPATKAGREALALSVRGHLLTAAANVANVAAAKIRSEAGTVAAQQQIDQAQRASQAHPIWLATNDPCDITKTYDIDVGKGRPQDPAIDIHVVSCPLTEQDTYAPRLPFPLNNRPGITGTDLTGRYGFDVNAYVSGNGKQTGLVVIGCDSGFASVSETVFGAKKPATRAKADLKFLKKTAVSLCQSNRINSLQAARTVIRLNPYQPATPKPE